MRRAATRSLVAGAVCVYLLAGALSRPAAGQMRIERIDLSRFPSVELRILLPPAPGNGGKPVPGDIRLDENGIPQRIDYFACPDDSIRLSIAILLDRSASMARLGDEPDPDSTKLRAARAAISTFVGLLSGRDEAALYSFATESFSLRHLFRVERDFTFDRQAIRTALSAVTAGGGTRLWQAVLDAVSLLKDRPGRRVLIVLTDGRNQFGEAYRTPAIRTAMEEGIPVYTIGLGVDADVGALSGLAEATGGRFLFAPAAEELESVFATLAGTLLTDACVLRYVSGNPCLDGSRRDITVEISGSGSLLRADSSYTLPNQLSPVTVRLEPLRYAAARDTLILPVSLLEQFSTKQALSCSMIIDYDADRMRFVRLRQQGTMTSNAVLSADEAVPGELFILSDDFLPFVPTGTLFELQFFCLPADSASTVPVEIRDAEVIGRCPTMLTTSSGVVEISPCEDRFQVGDSLQAVLPHDGREVLVPLLLRSTLPAGAGVQAGLAIDAAGAPYEIAGVETRGSICERGGVLVEEPLPGRYEFTAQGVSSGSDTVLFFLRLRARDAGKTPQVVPVPVTAISIATGCASVIQTVPRPRWATVLIDGICEPLVRPRHASVVGSHPNPFSLRTTVRITVPADGPVLLRIMDGRGRHVATLLDATLRRGEYVHYFDGTALPAGEYYAVFESSAGTRVHRMMLVK